MKLLNLVLDEFQDMELINVNATLQRANLLEKNDFYNPCEKKIVIGQYNIANIKTKIKVNLEDYDAIFIPGGKAAIHLRHNEKALKIIKDFINHNKTIIMICDAPNAIYEANLLPQEVKFSSFPVESVLNQNIKQRNEDNITHYKNFFSAKSANYSIDLGIEVIKYFKGKKIAQKTLEKLKGIVK